MRRVNLSTTLGQSYNEEVWGARLLSRQHKVAAAVSCSGQVCLRCRFLKLAVQARGLIWAESMMAARNQFSDEKKMGGLLPSLPLVQKLSLPPSLRLTSLHVSLSLWPLLPPRSTGLLEEWHHTSLAPSHSSLAQAHDILNRTHTHRHSTTAHSWQKAPCSPTAG